MCVSNAIWSAGLLWLKNTNSLCQTINRVLSKYASRPCSVPVPYLNLSALVEHYLPFTTTNDSIEKATALLCQLFIPVDIRYPYFLSTKLFKEIFFLYLIWPLETPYGTCAICGYRTGRRNRIQRQNSFFCMNFNVICWREKVDRCETCCRCKTETTCIHGSKNKKMKLHTGLIFTTFFAILTVNFLGNEEIKISYVINGRTFATLKLSFLLKNTNIEFHFDEFIRWKIIHTNTNRSFTINFVFYLVFYNTILSQILWSNYTFISLKQNYRINVIKIKWMGIAWRALEWAPTAMRRIDL